MATVDVIIKEICKRDFERQYSRVPDDFYNLFLKPRLNDDEIKLVEGYISIKLPIIDLDLDDEPTPTIYGFTFFRSRHSRNSTSARVEYFLGTEWVRCRQTRKLERGDFLIFVWVNNRLSLKMFPLKDKREGFMSFKQFVQEPENNVLPSEAVRRYEEYVSQKQYFEANKDKEWFMNKYNPIKLLTVVERRNELAYKVAKDLLLDLNRGSLSLLGPDAKAGHEGHIKKRWLRQFLKAPPLFSEPERIQRDIGLALALVTKLDSEKGIEDNLLSKDDTDKGLEGTKLLDSLLTYLWRVHAVDYYGMVEKVEPKGLRHVRDEGKDSDVSGQALEWEKKLVARWQERTCNVGPFEAMTAKEKVDAATAKALDPFVSKVRSEKHGWQQYGCEVKGCRECFEAPQFVKTHLKVAHPGLVLELTSKVGEDVSFQNFKKYGYDPGGCH